MFCEWTKSKSMFLKYEGNKNYCDNMISSYHEIKYFRCLMSYNFSNIQK